MIFVLRLCQDCLGAIIYKIRAEYRVAFESQRCINAGSTYYGSWTVNHDVKRILQNPAFPLNGSACDWCFLQSKDVKIILQIEVAHVWSGNAFDSKCFLT